MITNLFSSFDPSTSLNLSLNWISILLPLIITPFLYWFTPSRASLSIKLLYKYIINENISVISKHNQKIILLFITLFWFIIINNILGLFPYIFTSTSHIVITISLAVPIWIILIIYGWVNKTNHIFSHLVPSGTPIILSSFIVLIETVRNIIRPITLAVRLSANIIAGHLLITLLRQISEHINRIFIPTLPILIILTSLEFAVSIIQAYVFITLSSLYLSEIN